MQLFSNHRTQHTPWPIVDNEPINEYLTPVLAKVAFPTLFPKGRGDPANPSLYKGIPFAERIKHLFSVLKKLVINGFTALLHTLGLLTRL